MKREKTADYLMLSLTALCIAALILFLRIDTASVTVRTEKSASPDTQEVTASSDTSPDETLPEAAAADTADGSTEVTRSAVPTASPEDPAAETEGNASAEETVNINTASVAELTTLPGIGDALARRIVDWREENGPYETPEDLMNVSGIGEARFAAVQDRIVTAPEN